MKKIIILILAVVCPALIANAQNTSETSKVTLKNGTVIEGTVMTQGDDVIVTTANGDMFYYSRSEISRITVPRTSSTSRAESSESPALSFEEYKRAAKAAWRDVKTTDFWGDNTTSMRYYQKYKRRKNLSTVVCCTGAAVSAVGIVRIIVNTVDGWTYDEYYKQYGVYDYSYQILPFLASGCALIISGCVLTAPAKAKLKRSYEYYDNYGKNHAINVSTTPVVYAQGGAGLGIRINF